MWRLCFKIWAVANLLVLLVFAVPLLPQGLGPGLLALLYSVLFSFPAFFLLYGLLSFLRMAKGGTGFSWVVMLLGTAAISFAVYLLFRAAVPDAGGELAFVLPLSLVCGGSAVLLFCFPLQNWFEKFSYREND